MAVVFISWTMRCVLQCGTQAGNLTESSTKGESEFDTERGYTIQERDSKSLERVSKQGASSVAWMWSDTDQKHNNVTLNATWLLVDIHQSHIRVCVCVCAQLQAHEAN